MTDDLKAALIEAGRHLYRRKPKPGDFPFTTHVRELIFAQRFAFAVIAYDHDYWPTHPDLVARFTALIERHDHPVRSPERVAVIMADYFTAKSARAR